MSGVPARRMGEFAAREPVGPTEQPETPTELPVRPTDQPRQASKPPVQPSEKRLFTTFGYLVAKQGATAVLGLAYWVAATQLFSARDVGLAAAASSAAFFLGAIGALGIPLLLLAELESLPASARRVTFSTGMSISCLAVLILSLATLALSRSWATASESSAPTRRLLLSSWSDQWRQWAASLSTALQSDCYRGSAQLWRGSLNSVLKLAIVGVLVLVGTRTAPRSAVCLGTGTGCLARRLYPHASTRTDRGRRRAPQPSGALARSYGVLSSSTTSSICRSIPSTTSLL